jgi:hypothetical protein
MIGLERQGGPGVQPQSYQRHRIGMPTDQGRQGLRGEVAGVSLCWWPQDHEGGKGSAIAHRVDLPFGHHPFQSGR